MIKNTLAGRRKPASHATHVTELASICSGGSLLDVGCGDGALLVRAQTHGPWQRRSGADYVCDLVLFARQYYGLENVRWLDIRDGIPPDWLDAFDVVALTDVMEHVGDPASLLEASKGCLAGGAKMYVTWASSEHTDPLNPGEWQYWGMDSIGQACCRAGLELDHVFYSGIEIRTSLRRR